MGFFCFFVFQQNITENVKCRIYIIFRNVFQNLEIYKNLTQLFFKVNNLIIELQSFDDRIKMLKLYIVHYFFSLIRKLFFVSLILLTGIFIIRKKQQLGVYITST